MSETETKRALLRAKIIEKNIQRSSKAVKENVLNKTLKDAGLDIENFKKDMEAVKKQGGLEMNYKKS